MAELTAPLRFNPFVRPMPWGGRLLETLGKHLPGAEPYGESWEVSDHALAPSVVAEGSWAGMSLPSLMKDHRQSLLGRASEGRSVFPWLIKFLDAHDWLSVQVHPDEKAVTALWPGEGPKNEAWYVLDAQPGSRIYAGLLPGIGRAELIGALSSGTVAECLHHFQPRPGDFVYMSAGTVHAVGGGVLFAEIQQTSDATFRLFDWNRCDAKGQMRKLHVTQALECIDWSRGPVSPLHVPDHDTPGGDIALQLLRVPYFALDFVRHSAAFSLGGVGKLQALCVTSGQGRLESGEELHAGQVWIMPAAMARTIGHPRPTIAGILSTLP